jgi:hypothetical protein
MFQLACAAKYYKIITAAMKMLQNTALAFFLTTGTSCCGTRLATEFDNLGLGES